MEQNLELDSVDSSIMSKRERLKEMKANQEKLRIRNERQWLVKRGKAHLLDFQDKEILKLKNCFSALDDDGSGSIGQDELEEPLIGLGIADSREEVKDIVS